MKRRLALALVVLSTTGVFAQSVSKQLQDMKDAISAQQQQIMQLQQQVQNRDQAIQALQKQVGDAQAAAQSAQDAANRANKGEVLKTQRSARFNTTWPT